MRARSILPLLVLVFVAGVFVGIWIDWSAWKHKVSAQHVYYQLDFNQLAYLRVHAGDKISLMQPDANTQVQMNFLGGYVPCTPESANTDTCVISAKAPEGTYQFTCSSTPAGYNCFDPGVQHSLSPPPIEDTYTTFAQVGLSHLFGLDAGSHEEKHQPSKPEGAASTSTPPIQAFVSCAGPNNSTTVQDQYGGTETAISGTVGQSIYWSSLQPFPLVFKDYPDGFCAKGNPGSPGTKRATCLLNLPGKTVTYSVTAQDQNGNSCTPLTTATVTANAGPKLAAGGPLHK